MRLGSLVIQYKGEKVKKIKEYDLGINCSGYPLSEVHHLVIDKVYEVLTIKREVKNKKYKLVLYEVTDGQE